MLVRKLPLILGTVFICGLIAEAAGKSLRLCRDDEPGLGLAQCANESEVVDWRPEWRAGAHAERAHSYAVEQRKFDKAMSDYDRAVELDPGNLDIRVGRGQLRVWQRQYSSAVDDFTAALKIDGRDLTALQCREYASRQLGRHAEADADRRLLREIRPELGIGIHHPPCPPRF